MRTLIQRLFNRHPKPQDGLTQPQREAMIDLLLAAMYADNRVALEEDEQIATKLHTLSWESGTAPSTYLDTATARMREAMNTQAGEVRILESIRDRLATPDVRKDAFEMCVALLKSDSTENSNETEFERTVRALFDLQADVD